MTPDIHIDSDRCKKDGLCAAVCPGRVFAWSQGQKAQVVHPERCTFCGQCIAVCPGAAIEHSALNAEAFERIDHGTWPEERILSQFVASRRSIRAYKKKPVPRPLLERVAGSTGLAPTGAFGTDARIRDVILVSGEESMHRVAELTASYMRKLLAILDGFMVRQIARFSRSAATGRITVPDIRMRLERWETGENVITYDAPAAIFVVTDRASPTPHEDCDAALMNVLFTCHALGLGACWNGWIAHAATGEHVRESGELRAFLGLPSGSLVLQAATIGWPRFRHHSIPPRETRIRWV